MSKFTKKLNEYRIGDNWRENFDYINYKNTSEAVKKILTTKERKPHYDRLGNVEYRGELKELSVDEQTFRLCALIDSQVEAILNERFNYQPKPTKDTIMYEVDVKELMGY
jgi:hypothetical protein